jgi:hypothetical protein
MQKEAIKLGGGNMYKFIKNPTPEVKALMKWQNKKFKGHNAVHTLIYTS